MTGRFAQVTGWPIPVQRLESAVLPAASPGEDADSNTRTAAQAAAVAVPCCCTACSICSNFASDQVELSGLEPLTSCMPWEMLTFNTGKCQARDDPCGSMPPRGSPRTDRKNQVKKILKLCGIT